MCVKQQLLLIYVCDGSNDTDRYPDSIAKQDRTPELERHLQELLDLVGIGYLVSRWAGDIRDADEHKGWDHGDWLLLFVAI